MRTNGDDDSRCALDVLVWVAVLFCLCFLVGVFDVFLLIVNHCLCVRVSRTRLTEQPIQTQRFRWSKRPAERLAPELGPTWRVRQSNLTPAGAGRSSSRRQPSGSDPSWHLTRPTHRCRRQWRRRLFGPLRKTKRSGSAPHRFRRKRWRSR